MKMKIINIKQEIWILEVKREANQEDHAEDCKNLKADCQQKFETIKEKLTTGKKV